MPGESVIFVLKHTQIAMKTISLLIYEDAILSSVSGVMDMLLGVNRYMEAMRREPAFKLELVSEKMKNIQLHLPAQFICYKTGQFYLLLTLQICLLLAMYASGTSSRNLDRTIPFARIDRRLPCGGVP